MRQCVFFIYMSHFSEIEPICGACGPILIVDIFAFSIYCMNYFTCVYSHCVYIYIYIVYGNSLIYYEFGNLVDQIFIIYVLIYCKI